uniref:Sulfotransferase domain-containing protein n=1 Tax=Corethron hystrix TaxID=216773 RepID=A0A7S1BXJ7_9STRA|mmetsp:Transcript_43373/g.101761  ORF Transcript_43373/g.101761 Transcript_43373/m.101761 type:complete len:846 (+) Transcript_43373:224-2761(+)
MLVNYARFGMLRRYKKKTSKLGVIEGANKKNEDMQYTGERVELSSFRPIRSTFACLLLMLVFFAVNSSGIFFWSWVEVSQLYRMQEPIKVEENLKGSIYSEANIVNEAIEVEVEAEIGNPIYSEAIKRFQGGAKRDILGEIKEEASVRAANNMKRSEEAPEEGWFSTGTHGAKIRLVEDYNDVQNFKIKLPVISLGLIGTGTSLFGGYFHCGGYSVSHGRCLQKWHHPTFSCGSCINRNFETGMHLFNNCGIYDVWAQIGSTEAQKSVIYIPQVDQLREIVSYYPGSTFVLTSRSNSSEWAAKMMMDREMVKAFGLDSSDPNLQQELINFYENHERLVKQVVGDELVHIVTDSAHVGEQMEKIFGIKRECWGGKINQDDALGKLPGYFSTSSNGKNKIRRKGENEEIFGNQLVQQTPIINLGLLETHSELLFDYFYVNGYSVSHTMCSEKWFQKSFECGKCIQNEQHMLSGKCGIYDVWAQLGYYTKGTITDGKNTMSVFFPQVENLHEIVQKNSDATFILTTIDKWKWADTIMKSYSLFHIYQDSNLLRYLSITRETLANLHSNHERTVRNTVGDKLIILNMDSPAPSNDLEEHFGIDSKNFVSTHHKGELTPQSSFSISSGGIRSRVEVTDTLPPPSKLKLPTPVISMGFPKTGTTSLFAYFHCGRHASSHYRCSEGVGRFHCGNCIQWNIEHGNPILHGCGNFDVWAEINVSNTLNKIPTLFLPQVEHLDLIHRDYPNATFVLTNRNPKTWVESVIKWHQLHDIFIKSNITGLPSGSGKTVKELRNFFVGHHKRIQNFVHEHPSHTLVEINIDSKKAGIQLEEAFGVNAQCWGQSNKNNADP